MLNRRLIERCWQSAGDGRGDLEPGVLHDVVVMQGKIEQVAGRACQREIRGDLDLLWFEISARESGVEQCFQRLLHMAG
ncbi:hypothetical protein D3C81_1330820 [compost metagenome]